MKTAERLSNILFCDMKENANFNRSNSQNEITVSKDYFERYFAACKAHNLPINPVAVTMFDELLEKEMHLNYNDHVWHVVNLFTAARDQHELIIKINSFYQQTQQTQLEGAKIVFNVRKGEPQRIIERVRRFFKFDDTDHSNAFYFGHDFINYEREKSGLLLTVIFQVD